MITLNDIKRFLEPLRNKIYLVAGRGMVQAYNNVEKTQKIKFVTFGKEVYEQVERMEEYGFETYPDMDAEQVHLSIGGNKELTVCVCIHDRRYRPKYLTQGEVQMYTMFGVDHYIWLKKDKIIEAKGYQIYEIAENLYRVQCPTINLYGTSGGNASAVYIGGPNQLYRLIDERIYNAYVTVHTHSNVTNGPGVTGPPVGPPALNSIATSITKAK